MSSQKQVRELFALPKKEVIFDDFGCAFRGGILHHGRMYLTENYICFYSSIVGMNKKIILPISEIIKLTKTNTLGIKSIKFTQQGTNKNYRFTSFADCQSTFKIIQTLWSNISPHADQHKTDTEEDELLGDDLVSTNNDVGSLAGSNSVVREQSNIEPSTNISNRVTQQLDLSNGSSSNNAQQIVQQQVNMRVNGQIQEEIKIAEGRKGTGNDPNESGSQGVEYTIKSGFSEQQIQVQSNGSAVIATTTKVENANYEKAQGLQEIKTGSVEVKIAVEKSNMKDQQGSDYSKEDLDKLVDQFPIPENHEEIQRFQFGIPLNEFFTTYLIDPSPSQLSKFYHEGGEQKIVAEGWKDPEPLEQYEGRSVILATQLQVEFQLKDNPFVKSSMTTKYFKILEKTDTKIVMIILSKCTGVPYCDYFAIEEEWIMMSPAAQANVCSVRITAQVIFYKSTMFKGKIQTNAIKGAKDKWVEWSEWLKKKGIGFKEKKVAAPGANSKLTHGIEKSNKLFEKQNTVSSAVELTKKKTLKDKMKSRYNQSRFLLMKHKTDIMLVLLILLILNLHFKINYLESMLANQQSPLLRLT